jgi:hypothetical protein
MRIQTDHHPRHHSTDAEQAGRSPIKTTTAGVVLSRPSRAPITTLSTVANLSNTNTRREAYGLKKKSKTSQSGSTTRKAPAHPQCPLKALRWILRYVAHNPVEPSPARPGPCPTVRDTQRVTRSHIPRHLKGGLLLLPLAAGSWRYYCFPPGPPTAMSSPLELKPKIVDSGL